MFKRSRILFDHKKLKAIQDLYIANDKFLNPEFPYELQGQHLPRRKLNPFKKSTLKIIYDPNDYSQFILPSKKEKTFACK